MVTAELAVATLALLALLTLMCWGIYLLVLQVRLLDTAGEVARQSARGDRAAVERAEREAPAGASIRVEVRDGLARVRVRLAAQPLARGLVVVPLEATAEVVTEPGVGGS